MVKIVKTKINEQEIIDGLRDNAVGSIVIFIGEPRRNQEDGKVTSIEYSAYEEMAINELTKIEEETLKKKGIIDVVIVHRVGNIPLKETSLLVAVSSGHREEGFEASLWIVDEIKKKVPIWKEIKISHK
jgi:molybdopterin synthase catalytic subunit